MALLRKLDAVTIPVPDLDTGVAFYGDHLGHEIAWRHDAIGQLGLRLPESDTEIVLTTRQAFEPNWLVDDLSVVAKDFLEGGGEIVVEPFDIAVGRVAVVKDPFGNALVLLELSKGEYTTDAAGLVTGVERSKTRHHAADRLKFRDSDL